MAQIREVHFQGTHRLLSRKYCDRSLLRALHLPADVLANLDELSAATDEKVAGEHGRLITIGPRELVFAVPEAEIVNAAFTHTSETGGRFHGPDRGAWYAGVELETSFAEVAFHKQRFLSDTGETNIYTFDYQDFLADFSGEFHHLDPKERASCLKPGPVPQCYAAGQTLARALLYAGANGIVYPSVRHQEGTCVVCFRPALVFYPRRGGRYRLSLGQTPQWVKL